MAMGKAETVLELLATGTNLAALAGRKNNVGELIQKAVTIIKEDGPNLFGVGFDDESLWTDALRKAKKLDEKSDEKLLALLNKMNAYEKYFLRMVITNQKLPSEVVKQGDSTVVRPTDDVDKDPRVHSILYITGLVDDKMSNLDQVIADLRTKSIIKEKHIAFELWSDLVKKFEELAGGKDSKTLKKIKRALKKHNDQLEKEVGKQETAPDHPFFIRWLLRHGQIMPNVPFSEVKEVRWIRSLYLLIRNEKPKHEVRTATQKKVRVEPNVGGVK